jgi:hypothetical protein
VLRALYHFTPGHNTQQKPVRGVRCEPKHSDRKRRYNKERREKEKKNEPTALTGARQLHHDLPKPKLSTTQKAFMRVALARSDFKWARLFSFFLFTISFYILRLRGLRGM